MLAYCFDGGLNGLGLMGTRLAAAFAASYALVVLAKMIYIQPKDRRRRQVARSVIIFTMFWAAVNLSTSSVLLATPCSFTLSPAVRTLYGQSFAWTIAGLVIVVSMGAKHNAKLRTAVKKIPADVITEAVQRIIQEHPDIIESKKDEVK